MFIYLLVFTSFNKSHYNSLVCTYGILDSKVLGENAQVLLPMMSG